MNLSQREIYVLIVLLDSATASEEITEDELEALHKKFAHAWDGTK